MHYNNNYYNASIKLLVVLCCRERAEKFYEQALLLVDCCKIPQAITLLEQVCNIE